MQAVPSKVIGLLTHKTPMFLPLVVVHDLGHSQTQTLHNI